MDDVRLKSKGLEKLCNNCEIFAYEDSKHMVLQCGATRGIRERMFDEMCKIGGVLDSAILCGPKCLEILLEAASCHMDIDNMTTLRVVSSEHICEMYSDTIKRRDGIG